MSEAITHGTPEYSTRAAALEVERNWAALAAAPEPAPVPVPAAVPVPATHAAPVPVPHAASAAAPTPAPVPAPVAAPAVPRPVSAPEVPAVPMLAVDAVTAEDDGLSALDHAAMNDEAFVVHEDPWADVTNEADGSITLDVPTGPSDDDSGEEEDDEDDDSAAASRRPNSARRTAAKERALVRRTVAKVLEVQSASADLVAVAASILGVHPDNTADLTVAIITANSRDLQVVGDLKTILDADSLEAGVTATALGRTRLRGVWNLLAGLGGVTGSMPSSDPKAAIALVRALHAGDSETIRGRVDQAVTLLRGK